MSPKLWSRENLAWLSGILEGEGCFMVIWKKSKAGSKYPAFSVSANMNDGDVLRRVAEIAGAGVCQGPYPQKNPKHHDFYRWKLNKRDEIYALCIAIYPWMGERRQERIRAILVTYRSSFQPTWRHGTRRGYDRGCRCDECRAVHAARQRLCRKRRLARLQSF